jgi:[acyl-carrier-protein] S-malonyltransferase
VVSIFFPGQGSQKPGMGKSLYQTSSVARGVFEEADEALGFALSQLCFEGPEEKLRQTEYTQPAILTVSVAAYRALAQGAGNALQVQWAAGHSLGEWSALVAVGALEFRDAVRLVRERGRLMQVAVADGEGAMAAVLGASAEDIERVCQEVSTPESLVAPANFNAPDQIVISGHAAAVDRAADRLEELDAKRIIPLPVSAPFHSPLMQPAAHGLAKALSPIAVGALTAPVVSNVEARPNQDPSRVKALLIQQLTAPVRWVEIVQFLRSQGVESAIEIGPGKVLTGLARKIDRGLTMHNIEDHDSLEQVLAWVTKQR